MEILDLFPQIEVEFLTINPCVNNKVHLEIGLVKDRDNSQTGRPANFKRAHAKFCVDLTQYFCHESSTAHQFSLQNLTNHCSESVENQPQIIEPEATPASAAQSLNDYCADLTESDLDIAKDIQLCLCDQCEFKSDIDIENQSLFEEFDISDADMLTEEFRTMNIAQ